MPIKNSESFSFLNVAILLSMIFHTEVFYKKTAFLILMKYLGVKTMHL